MFIVYIPIVTELKTILWQYNVGHGMLFHYWLPTVQCLPFCHPRRWRVLYAAWASEYMYVIYLKPFSIGVGFLAEILSSTIL